MADIATRDACYPSLARLPSAKAINRRISALITFLNTAKGMTQRSAWIKKTPQNSKWTPAAARLKEQ
jgi:hypothetical protein